MNIIEALNSGKRFRRKSQANKDYWFHRDIDNAYHARDLLADDWEIEQVPVTITRNQFDQAYVKAVAKLPSNSTTKVLIDMIAEELGL